MPLIDFPQNATVWAGVSPVFGRAGLSWQSSPSSSSAAPSCCCLFTARLPSSHTPPACAWLWSSSAGSRASQPPGVVDVLVTMPNFTLNRDRLAAVLDLVRAAIHITIWLFIWLSDSLGAWQERDSSGIRTKTLKISVSMPFRSAARSTHSLIPGA